MGVTIEPEAALRQVHDTISVSTSGPGLHEVTSEVASMIRESGVSDGCCTLVVQHTSASLTIQENADPSARRDLEAFLKRLVPEGDPLYEHVAEGPDDMPAHVRSALTLTTLTLPVQSGRLRLGTWQGIYLWEHRRRGRHRQLAVHVLGE